MAIDMLEHASPSRRQRTFGRYSSANLDIRLFNHHASLKGPASGAAILRCQDPLAIGISKSRDRYHANAGVVVATVPRTKADAPSSLQILAPVSPSRVLYSYLSGFC